MDKTDKAISFLLAHGYVMVGEQLCEKTGEKISNPIAAATEIAIEEAIKRENLDSNNFMQFSGDDKCSDCSGWDGKSQRCDCGNRRVSWETDGDFENIIIYAAAY
jgi:hypothetical protein